VRNILEKYHVVIADVLLAKGAQTGRSNGEVVLSPHFTSEAALQTAVYTQRINSGTYRSI